MIGKCTVLEDIERTRLYPCTREVEEHDKSSKFRNRFRIPDLQARFRRKNSILKFQVAQICVQVCVLL